jgi:hypothetical protein
MYTFNISAAALLPEAKDAFRFRDKVLVRQPRILIMIEQNIHGPLSLAMRNGESPCTAVNRRSESNTG